MAELSVIIPSFKDPLLFKTIDSILEASALGDHLEIIAVFDGYWPVEVREDPRVKYIHLGKNRGMRDAINAGVAVSKGTYIMRTDEHCVFAKDFDTTVLATIQENWIVTMRRYFLDPVKWAVMPEQGYVDFEKLVIQDNTKFSGQRWPSRTKELEKMMIAETMAMQGSCWLMPRAWWDKVIGALQSEGYGTLYQDSHEMVFKTWKAGGKLMLNKNTWYAHKHRSFPRTHQHTEDQTKGWKYSLDLWREYYEKEILPRWAM